MSSAETDDFSQHTPMMRQFFSIKADFPDTLVFYRMGDFYEVFFDDARKANALLDVTLTTRGQSGGNPVVMAGVPVHALESYLGKLIKLGESVAIAEQVGEVGLNKGPVERKVVRVVTPGTVTDSELLADKQDSVLLAVPARTGAVRRAGAGLLARAAVSRRSVGRPREASASRARRAPAHHESPGLAVRRQARSAQAVRATGCRFAARPERPRHARRACRRGRPALLRRAHARPRAVACEVAAGATRHRPADLPPATQRNLELTMTLRGETSPTLLSLLDTCRTGMGSRALRHWLLHPLRDRAAARERQDAIAELMTTGFEPLREALRQVSDVERISARIALRQVHPAELAQTVPVGSSLLDQLAEGLRASPHLAELLTRAIAEEPSAMLREGGVIATGFDEQLDELRGIQTNCDDFLLKLEYNKVHGFYIEVTTSGLDKVPSDYQRRQTLKNAERFITPELKDFEDKALSAQERALSREKMLYELVIDQLTEELQALGKLARSLASVDVLSALAERAGTLNWCRPEFVSHPCIEIQGGRHPVVEARLRETGAGEFMANDCRLDARTKLLVITGPNMGGKSTFMRQVALIALLSAVGSHVPAAACRLGPIDAIHTRIGAGDDLARGQSTFMVEMAETSYILHHATAHSLVLMDEIGRGTSTYDGLALADAVARHLAYQNRCYTLFATHYFELTAFPAKHPQAVNMHVSAVESGEDIVFLHEIQPAPPAAATACRSRGWPHAGPGGAASARVAGGARGSRQRGRNADRSLRRAARTGARCRGAERFRVAGRLAGHRSRRAQPARGARGALPAQGAAGHGPLIRRPATPLIHSPHPMSPNLPPTPTTKTIVFSHANGFPSGCYRVLFDIWREAGWQVHALPRIGHDPRFPVTSNWPHLRDELLQFIEHEVQPAGPVTLVGHSLGGLLSLLATCRKPALVQAW
ncbi:mutS domain V domain-containing protein [Ditylenchus destructor]|nr:mutS domain V domain-containing protein [Ditylenchus destructor]